MKEKGLSRNTSSLSNNKSFNQSINMSLNSSYQNLLCKAIKDIKQDDDMFTYLHREMGKIKTPSTWNINLNKSDIVYDNYSDKYSSLCKEPARNNHKKSKKKKTMNCNIGKKHFLLNDDDLYSSISNNTKLLEGINSYENMNKMILLKGGKYVKTNDSNKKNDSLQKTFGNIATMENSSQSKDYQSNIRLELSELLNDDIFDHKILLKRTLERAALKYYRYENLCFMIKLTFLSKYTYRQVLIRKIIKMWQRYTKINNEINKQFLFKSMHYIFRKTLDKNYSKLLLLLQSLNLLMS